MIITEIKIINGKSYKHTFSDIGHKIKKLGSGMIYDDALDEENARHVYVETDIPIESA